MSTAALLERPAQSEVTEDEWIVVHPVHARRPLRLLRTPVGSLAFEGDADDDTYDVVVTETFVEEE